MSHQFFYLDRCLFHNLKWNLYQEMKKDEDTFVKEEIIEVQVQKKSNKQKRNDTVRSVFELFSDWLVLLLNFWFVGWKPSQAIWVLNWNLRCKVELLGKNDSLPLIYNCQLLCLVLYYRRLIINWYLKKSLLKIPEELHTTDGQGGRSTDSDIFKNCFVLDFSKSLLDKHVI